MKGKFVLNKGVFWPPFILLVGVVVLSFVNDEIFATTMSTTFQWIQDHFNWLNASAALFGVLFLLFLMFHPKASKVKFGGEDAKPEFSNWQWFAICLCASMAIGVTFWGVGEPIQHLAQPPASLGLEPFSSDAAYFSLTQTYIHWTLPGIASYLIFGIGIGLAHYNHGKPLAISSSYYFIMGDRYNGIVGKIVDIICIFGISCGVSQSLGLGTMQMGRGLESLFGIPSTPLTWGIIATLIILGYTVSSYTGLHKGIAFLSRNNTKLYIITLVIVFILGPTRWILDVGVESTGKFIMEFIPRLLQTGTLQKEVWYQWWPLYFWFSYYAFAPMIGCFWARLMRGRTIREVVVYNLLIPCAFGYIWFMVIGGTAINFQMTGVMDIWANMQEFGLEGAIWIFLKHFPLGIVLCLAYVVLIYISFVTLADSMTSSVATMSTKNVTDDREAPGILKIFWGVAMGASAFIMIMWSGINGAKTIAVVGGFPVLILMVIGYFIIIKAVFFKDKKMILSWKEIRQNLKEAKTVN